MLALDSRLAAQVPQTREPPLIQPQGPPAVRNVPPGPPAVRDVPTPATPPRVRAIPAPRVPETQQAHVILNPTDPPAPVVSIRVRVPAVAAPNEDLEYHLTVENHGKAAAHHVIVRNPLPAHAAFVRSDPPPNLSDPVLEWRLGTLESCARREILLVLKPGGTGDVQNCARVQFEHGECVLTKIAAPIASPPAGQPRLQVRKTGPAQAVLHDPISYQLVVTNAGAAAVQAVELTDQMPEGMEDGKTGKSRLTWSVGTLGAGESRRYEYQVITKKAGRLCNRAVVTAGELRDETETCVEVRESKPAAR